MGNFADNIRPYVDAELEAAARDPAQAFRHLERAHVLGQASTRQHVRVHWRMLCWAWQQRDAREFFGQSFRLAGARAHDPAHARVTTLGEEKRVNAFLRLQNPEIIARLRERFPGIGEHPDARAVFVKLRELRNRW